MSPSESHITGQSGASCSQESLNQFKTDWERAIRGGPQPVIAAYMDKVSESERVVVQNELQRIDQEYRHRLAKSTHAEIDLTTEIVSPTTEEETTELNLSANEHEDAGTLSTAAFISEEKAEKGNLHEKRSTPASPGSIAKTLGALEEYELLDELGRGGMGVVYKARERSVNRVVALKMMLAGQFASPEALRRFQIEAESVASLDHPNIIPIYHVGEINGMPYFVMKYVDGTSLDRFARGRFTTEPQAAAELLRKICLAVHFAHQRGILHRDLKPGNILIDQHGEPHITDFGLAKRMDQDQGETQTGTVIGTPDYMSPEQAAGLSNNVSVASDVYSLGSVLFDLLTGEPPFRSKTMMQTLMRVTKEPVRSPTSLNRSIGLDLETICLKCLDKDSERRYSSAGEVAAELERYLKGHPIHGRRVGKLERTQRWCRRNPKVAMLGAFAFVLLTFLAVAGPIAALQFAHQADRYRRLAYVTAMRVAHQECIEGEIENAIELLEEHIPQPNQQDLRGFEWYHLWRLCQRNLTAQAIKIETGGKVRDILFCEEGQAVISASSFERSSSSFVEIRKWSASKPSSNATDVLASRSLDGIGFQKLSPDGKVLAVGHNDGHITLLNISTGATASLDGLTAAVLCLAFSPDGTTLAAGDFAGSVRLWNVSSTEELVPIAPHADRVYCVAFSPDGKRLCSGSRDQTAKLWDVETGTLSFVLDHDKICQKKSSVWSVTFSPDGKSVAAGTSGDFVVAVWSVHNGRLQNKLSGSEGYITALAFSPDGLKLASGGGSRKIRLWDIHTGELLQILRGNAPAPSVIAFSPDGTKLACEGMYDDIKLWPLYTQRGVTTLRGHRDNVRYVSFSPNGETLASASSDKTVKLWDVKKGIELFQYEGHDSEVWCLSFSPTGKVLASGSSDNTLRIWDVSSKDQLKVLQHDSDVRAVAYSGDAKLLASGTADGMVVLWDAGNYELVCRFPAYEGQAISSLVFSSDHKTLIITSYEAVAQIRDKRVKLWDVGTRTQFNTISNGVAIKSLAYSSDDHLLALGAKGTGTVSVYDIESGEFILTVEDEHGQDINAIAFSPDLKSLISACGGPRGNIKFWDAASGELRFRLDAHLDAVYSIAISPNGTTLATASADDTVKLFHAASDKEIDEMRSRYLEDSANSG